MSKVLIIEPSDRVISILSETLTEQFGLDFVAVKTIEEGLNVVNHSFNLVVCRNKIGEDEAAKKILNYLYDNSYATKVIVLGKVEFSGVEFEVLPDRFRIEQFKREVRKLLNITAVEIDSVTLPDYLPVPFYHLYLMEKAPCDIYIRLEREAADDKYVKRIRIDDTFNKAVIQKYEENNVKALYISKEQRHLFMEELVNQSLKSLEKAENIVESVDVIQDLYRITASLVTDGKVDTHSSKLFLKTVDAMDGVINSVPTFLSIFKLLMDQLGDLNYRKAFIIMLFSNAILEKIDWLPSNKIKEAHQSIMYMAFFSDIFLADEELLRINTNQKLKDAELDDEQVELIKNHANMAATLVQSIPGAPSGVDVIISQHHGTFAKGKFPDHYTSGISKMAIIYIVLENFAWRVIDYTKGEDSIEDIFMQMMDEFTLPTYKSVVKALESLFVS